MALKIGDRVMVRNSTMSGKRFDEGLATVKKVNDTDEHYQVEFDDERGRTYPRFVTDEQKRE